MNSANDKYMYAMFCIFTITMYPSIDLVLFWNSIACVVCNGLHGEKECTPMNMYPELKGRENKESHKCEHKKNHIKRTIEWTNKWTQKWIALSSQSNNGILIDFLIDKNGYGFILWSIWYEICKAKQINHRNRIGAQ